MQLQHIIFLFKLQWSLQKLYLQTLQTLAFLRNLFLVSHFMIWHKLLMSLIEFSSLIFFESSAGRIRSGSTLIKQFKRGFLMHWKFFSFNFSIRESIKGLTKLNPNSSRLNLLCRFRSFLNKCCCDFRFKAKAL